MSLTKCRQLISQLYHISLVYLFIVVVTAIYALAAKMQEPLPYILFAETIGLTLLFVAAIYVDAVCTISIRGEESRQRGESN